MDRVTAAELLDAWSALSGPERVEAFRALPATEADDLLQTLSARDQAELFRVFPEELRRHWIRLLPPDDLADLLQEMEPDERSPLLAALDTNTRHEVTALLSYAEDEAGGIMNPRFIILRPEMNADEAIRYVRIQAHGQAETIYYQYVIDAQGRLVGVVTLRQLMMAPRSELVANIMEPEVVSVREDDDQERVSRIFREYGFIVVPVVDDAGRMVGVITVDDIVDVVNEEATEDIHKLGGTESLEAPYLETSIADMVRKRGGWLAALFFGGLLTATAMSYFADDIARAVVLALFLPLIISSGGNSGSQAATLVVRAMALSEVRLSDWWRVVRREFITGAILGGILAALGLLRVVLWEWLFGEYGPNYLGVAFTVSLSILGIVLWGTFIGSTLPFMLRRAGFDPASSSAPLVTTIIDVTGIILYFTVAGLVLTAIFV